MDIIYKRSDDSEWEPLVQDGTGITSISQITLGFKTLLNADGGYSYGDDI